MLWNTKDGGLSVSVKIVGLEKPLGDKIDTGDVLMRESVETADFS